MLGGATKMISYLSVTIIASYLLGLTLQVGELVSHYYYLNLTMALVGIELNGIGFFQAFFITIFKPSIFTFEPLESKTDRASHE